MDRDPACAYRKLEKRIRSFCHSHGTLSDHDSGEERETNTETASEGAREREIQRVREEMGVSLCVCEFGGGEREGEAAERPLALRRKR